MSPRVLMLHPDRRLERLCDDVVHLRRAYRRRPDPAVLGPIARKAGIPAGTFICLWSNKRVQRHHQI